MVTASYEEVSTNLQHLCKMRLIASSRKSYIRNYLLILAVRSVSRDFMNATIYQFSGFFNIIDCSAVK